MLVSANRKKIAQLAADLRDKKATHEMLSALSAPEAEIAMARAEYLDARDALEQAMPNSQLLADFAYRL